MLLRFSMSAIMLVATSALPVVGQEIHADLCLHGCPAGSSATNDIVVRDIYILSSNDTTKFADWVAYRVTKDTIGKTAQRRWKVDPRLAEDETLEPKDYKGAFAALKTDRGHQVPLASFTKTSNWETTNYLSNITPQKSALNQGVWVKLENAVRTLAKRARIAAVYVMTGPLFERKMPTMPGADEPHLVPSGYWKIVATEEKGNIKTASFIFDQETERKASFCEKKFLSRVRIIEGKTGLNFYHALTRVEQNTLETGPGNLLPDLGCTS